MPPLAPRFAKPTSAQRWEYSNKILVISGTQADLPAKDGKFIAQQVPSAQYVELNASHLSNIELPAFI